jgi:hypothetical protein
MQYKQECGPNEFIRKKKSSLDGRCEAPIIPPGFVEDTIP